MFIKPAGGERIFQRLIKMIKWLVLSRINVKPDIIYPLYVIKYHRAIKNHAI